MSKFKTIEINQNSSKSIEINQIAADSSSINDNTVAGSRLMTSLSRHNVGNK